MPLNEVRKRLIHLHSILLISRKMLYHLLEKDSSLQNIYTMTSTEISSLFSISIEKSINIKKQLHHKRPLQIIESNEKKYSIITIFDKEYPKQLKNLYDAPLVLYTIGNSALLNKQPSLSVIGTRFPSSEGVPKLNVIVSPIVKEGWVIISGMAYGIDSSAHLLTTRLKGETIAVLGSGFHHVYPKENIPLFNKIIESGLVVSEYPPDTPARKYYFPERNRIISGLSNATLVIEAKKKSGTLITVDQALEQGKEVYAVPGSPLIKQTEGCHQMIQDGAKLVTSATDILEDW